MKETVILALAACGAAVLILLLRNTGGLKKLVAGGVGGLAAFGVVNLTGMFTGVSLAANLWTLSVSVLMGIPGVVGMMFIKLILKV